MLYTKIDTKGLEIAPKVSIFNKNFKHCPKFNNVRWIKELKQTLRKDHVSVKIKNNFSKDLIRVEMAIKIE